MKPWAYVIILTLIVGAISAVYSKGHNAGYDKAKQEETESRLEYIEEEVARRTQEWIETQGQAEVVIEYRDRIVTEIEYVDREIPTYIDRIIEVKPECARLPTLAELLNKQIRAANGESLQDADPPAELVDGVSGTQ